MKSINILVLFFVALLIVSCDDNSIDNKKGNILDLITTTGTGNSFDEIIANWDNGNLTGVISIRKQNRNDYVILTHQGVQQKDSYDGWEATSYAGLFSNYSASSAINVLDFAINAMDMQRYAKGAYSIANYMDFEANFGGGQNIIYIEPKDNFPGLIDSVIFDNELIISNVSRDDTIRRSDDVTINWTGGATNGKVKVDFTITDGFADGLDDDNTGFSYYCDNTGTAKLFSSLLSSLENDGCYNLTVTSYEPVYRTLSNGKQILIIGESSHRVTVNLAD